MLGPRLVGVRAETTTRSLGGITEPDAVGRFTVAEGILAKSTMLEHLQTGSNKNLSVRSEPQRKESEKGSQDLTALLRENTFSGQLNGVADGLGEVALETVQGVAALGVSGVKTVYDLLLGSSASEFEFAAEEITGRDVQLPEWAPDSDRGVERLQTGADVIAEIAFNPGLIIDAIVDPIKEDWAQGRYGEAIGRGIGELVSVTAGVQGAGKLVAEIPEAFKPANIMEWSPEKQSPWSEIPGTTLLSEINKIRIKDKDGAETNCINCTIATELSSSGHPTSALVTKDPSHGKDIEEMFDAKFQPVERLADIESMMLKAGHGARGVIGGTRLNGRSHVYNVNNDHGTIKYLEGQMGVVDFKYKPGFIRFAFFMTHKNVNLPGESIKVLQAVSPSNAGTAEIDKSRTGSAESDGTLDTALGWLLGKAEVGELESSNDTGRSIGDQKIVEENFARLNRNEPRLTADEEDAIRESAELAGSAGDDPET
ncbi:MAG: toxin glutamine deamidase domain-containing protein, partial [Granulosicoccus sp.]